MNNRYNNRYNLCSSIRKHFMTKFEKQHIYPYIKNKSILYLRYIDDIFMIWTETKVVRSQMEKCLKPIQKAEKEDVNLATQVNHHYVESSLLTLVHFKVTKHSNYAPYFTN